MIILESVVLPQPLSPTNPKHSPRRICRLTSATARIVCAWPPIQPVLRVVNVLLTLSHPKLDVGADRARLVGLDQRPGLMIDLPHRNQPLARLHVEMRHGAQQRAKVGMPRRLEDRMDFAGLHHLSAVEHDDLIGEIRHHTEIVGDDQHRHAERSLQVLQQARGSAPGS